MKRKARKVSYWDTQPGMALFLSLISLGQYVPLSFIPLDVETSQEPSGAFKKQRVHVPDPSGLLDFLTDLPTSRGASGY
jgi:hypothetical protein